uniref:G-protein coupled receptors family 1 profile domain-containing protein n=1 Tax=Salvator merianae TaxID=96440 RepID=A0A8D0BII6_SALMN
VSPLFKPTMNASSVPNITAVEKTMRHIAIITDVIILILGTSGNGLVMWTIAKREKQKTITSICYLNLAVADFLFSAGRIPALVQEIMYSQWPFGLVLCNRISEVMEIVSMTIYSITLLLGTVGNGLVIFLTGFCMKKTVTTIWYLNLAVADFIFAVCLSLEIISTALENHWPLGRLMCKLDAVIPFLNMFASVFFLTVISADRCISVVHPVWAVNHRTLGRAIQIAIFIWVAASMLSFPYFIFRDTQDFPDGSTQCSYMFGGEDTSGLRNHLSVVKNWKKKKGGL